MLEGQKQQFAGVLRLVNLVALVHLPMDDPLVQPLKATEESPLDELYQYVRLLCQAYKKVRASRWLGNRILY